MSVLLLIGQLAWPRVVRWWELPGPGTIGIDRFEHPILARDFLIRLPNDYNRAPQPLIVFLHGAGERGNDPGMLRECGPLPLDLPAIVAAPQCLPSLNWEADAVARFARHVTSAYHVDQSRVYIVGYSMGAVGTWRTAAAHPDAFAAIVPIAGGGETKEAASLVRVPIWAFHGADDNVVPVSSSKQTIEAVRIAGGKPKFTVIPNAGHGICSEVCTRSDLWQWLLRQRLPDSDIACQIKE